MVYNTTDNSTSLNIIGLKNGEYSVTVAGRDGARRLGKESEELLMPVIGTYSYIHAYIHVYVFIMQIYNSSSNNA